MLQHDQCYTRFNKISRIEANSKKYATLTQTRDLDKLKLRVRTSLTRGHFIHIVNIDNVM